MLVVKREIRLLSILAVIAILIMPISMAVNNTTMYKTPIYRPQGNSKILQNESNIPRQSGSGSTLDLFAVDKNLLFLENKWQLSWSDPTSWFGTWEAVGGKIYDQPVVEYDGYPCLGCLEVFVIGGDNALWHKWQTTPSDGWSGWASEGGYLMDLTLGKNADGRLEVFVIGGDNSLWHKWQTAPNDGWSGWASEGGYLKGLTVGNNADGRLETFVIGGDDALWHKWQTTPNDGWSTWASLG